VAFHFHWPLGEILDLEHPLRRAFVGQIEEINARLAADTEDPGDGYRGPGDSWMGGE
jgi:hypothetical protein